MEDMLPLLICIVSNAFKSPLERSDPFLRAAGCEEQLSGARDPPNGPSPLDNIQGPVFRHREDDSENTKPTFHTERGLCRASLKIEVQKTNFTLIFWESFPKTQNQ